MTSNTVDIRSYTGDDGIPTLILVDLQQEYLAPHRPLGLKNPQSALGNCRQLLAEARACKWPVAFVRWAQCGTVFNHKGQFSGWLDGFNPTGSDMIFERQLPSCYSSSEFTEMMNDCCGRNALIAGFTGAIACLSTIVEGVSRQHSFTFIWDASASHAHRGKDESEAHGMATFVISSYAEIKSTKEVIKRFAEQRMSATHKIGDDYAIR